MIGATVSWQGRDYKIAEDLPYDGWFDWSSIFSSWGGEYAFTTQGEGYHDWNQGGIWVPGKEITKTKDAIILPLSKSDLKYDVGGTYTRQDVKVYLQCPDGGFRIYFARRIEEGS